MRLDLAFPEESPDVRLQIWADQEGLIASDHALRDGTRHWHLRQPGKAGTVEVTWCQKKGQFWGEVRPHRAGDWTDAALHKLLGEFGQP